MFSRGPGTYEVPMTLHAENRQRLLARFAAIEGLPQAGSVILLQGGVSFTRDATDHEPVFRQESFFQWAFGVKEPDCFGALDLTTKKSTLFFPRLPESYVVWMGHIPTPEELKAQYLVDEVRYTDEIVDWLNEHLAPHGKLHLLQGVNTDSGLTHKPAHFDGIDKFKHQIDTSILWNEMVECRVIKTAAEIALLRYVCKASSDAHIHVMKNVKPGMMEYHAEADFKWFALKQKGCRHVAYTCICGSGASNAILHYGHAGAPNNKLVDTNDMVLLDMGAEYHCYCSDITCSYPVSGKFTEEQKIIYNIVLEAQRTVIKALKPGVHYLDMHRLAYEVILTRLLEIGLVRNGTVEELIEADIGFLFMPHGLGHFLGLDTHDVGGVPPGVERPTKPGFKSVRLLRKLEENMVLTVEPGVYFNMELIQKAMEDPNKAKYLNMDMIMKFKYVGGVRIEDDVVITKDGCELLSQVPRTVEEIEELLKQNPHLASN